VAGIQFRCGVLPYKEFSRDGIFEPQRAEGTKKRFSIYFVTLVISSLCVSKTHL
jgi:hypothetical protein